MPSNRASPFLVPSQIKDESSCTIPETKDWGRPSSVEMVRSDWVKAAGAISSKKIVQYTILFFAMIKVMTNRILLRFYKLIYCFKSIYERYLKSINEFYHHNLVYIKTFKKLVVKQIVKICNIALQNQLLQTNNTKMKFIR